MGQIVVVRHGQASFGADDYDVLSEAGEEQARVVGRTLATLEPDLVVHGSLVRQRRTAELAAGAAGWGAPLREDARWNELESLAQFAAVSGSPVGLDRAGFQQWYEGRWPAGPAASTTTTTPRPTQGFSDRANAALADVAGAGHGRGGLLRRTDRGDRHGAAGGGRADVRPAAARHRQRRHHPGDLGPPRTDPAVLQRAPAPAAGDLVTYR